MATGDFNSFVQIQKRTVGRDVAGQRIEGWEAYDYEWADIRFNAGQAVINAQADMSEARASVRIRFRTDLNAGMRLLYEGMAFDVQTVLPDFRKREHTDLVCVVGVNDG